MNAQFQKYGVRVVALSSDTPDRARFHLERDQLTLQLLCDPELRVISDYGLLHRRGISFRTFFFLGVPLGVPAGFKEMAIPTTILVDEKGIIRWIDQAEDYRMRGDEARIARALQDAFG